MGARPSLNRPLPVYRIDDVLMMTESGPDVSSEDQDMLGSLMRHLLPTPAVSPPRVTPIPSDREQLMQRLMGKEHPVRPLLLPAVGQLPAVGCHESTVVCLSCGESGHAASRCPILDDSFPFLPLGWQADWTGDGFVMRPPQKGADRHQAENVV